MQPYAQTYPQLMNQAIALGRPECDLARLRRGYEFTERMCDGLYRAQSVPFSCHLVRAGSVVMDCGYPVHVVIAAMIHAAYRLRRFRDSRRRTAGPSRRRYVAQQLGADVERVLEAYERLPWYKPEELDKHLAGLSAADEVTRQVLTIRLADELDDAMDLALAYIGCGAVESRVAAYGQRCVELADRLGHPQLAEALSEADAAYDMAKVPECAILHRPGGYERSRRHLWEMSRPASLALGMARFVQRRIKGRHRQR